MLLGLRIDAARYTCEPSTFRYTTQDVPLGDAVIPAHAQVIISLAAANRDPDRYQDAESFDITRSDSSHLAFGHGIHHCLGARLARLESLIAFTTLLDRFPAMRLAVPPSALRWSHGDGLVLRGLTELPVTLGSSPYPPRRRHLRDHAKDPLEDRDSRHAQGLHAPRGG